MKKITDTSVKVLGISTSPRINGNSDLLLQQALAGATSAAAQVEYMRLCDLNIAACTECNICYMTGKCKIEDDYQMVLARMLEADRLIFATPIFFMTVCAQAKLLIDRCQCLWAHKAVLKKPLPHAGKSDRLAMVIVIGGSKSTKMFEYVRPTIKSYFDAIDMRYAAGLFVNKVDEFGQIEKHPTAMKEAFRLGRKLAAIDAFSEQEVAEVELT